MIRIRVNGTPAPQGSKRAIRSPSGRVNLVEDSKRVGPWREAVRAEVQRAVEMGWGHTARRREVIAWAGLPMEVRIVFVLPRPAAHFGTGRNRDQVKPSAPARPARKPDVDKLARAVLDGLVAGGVMADDAQVVDLNVSKVYAANGDAPGAIIEVEACGAR